MSRRYRAAIVGGNIGGNHIRGYQELPELFEVATLCDLDEARLAKVADEFGIPGRTTRFDEILADPSIDIVNVCTPPDLHFPMAKAALEAGKHVVCEKPLFKSLADVDAMAEILKKPGMPSLMPVFQYRFGNGLLKTKALIDQGLAGKPFVATVETHWARDSVYYSVPWRGKLATEWGGVLITHAIHAHDSLCWLLGPIKSVFARIATRVNDIETEDCAALSLEMANGALVTLSATLGSATEISRLRLCFEHFTAESSLTPYRPGEEPWTVIPRGEANKAAIERSLAAFQPGPESYAGQFLRYHAALETGGEPPVTLADARASLELLTAVYHSVRTKAPVELPIGREHPKHGGWL